MLHKLRIFLFLLVLVFFRLMPLYGADLSGSEKVCDSSLIPNFSSFANNFSLDSLCDVSHDWWGKSYVDDDEPKIVKWTVTTYSGDKETRIESIKIKDLCLLGKIGLPKDIALFTNLQTLNLSETCLFSAPFWWERYSPSYYLLLDFNEPTFDFLSEDITSLTSLKKLNLNSNYLTVLPDSISQLVNLKGLFIISNKLIALPESIIQLVNLKKLFIDSNKLTSLPSTFHALSRLTDLSLDSNRLSDLPASFGKLPCLKSLNLRNNKFTFFPPEILDLIALESLYIDDNKIQYIPIEIGNMKNLKTITVRNNRLLKFPNGALKLEKLDFLALTKNPCLGKRAKDYSDKAYSHKDGKFHNKIEKLKSSFK